MSRSDDDSQSAGPSAKGAAASGTRPAPDRDSLIEYPCAFPIKVMGMHVPGFEEAIVSVTRQFDDRFDPSLIERRPSRTGQYLGLTITITATSRQQLDDLYRALTAHPMVKVVL